MIGTSDLSEIRTQARPFTKALLTSAALAAFLLAVLLAIVFGSLNLFLIVLGLAALPLIAISYPLTLAVTFLFLNLLLPKVPLIQIRGYLVPIRIEDVFLGCALICLCLRYLIFRERPAPNPFLRWMLVFCATTGISFLFGLFVLRTVPEAKIGFLFWLRTAEYFAAGYLCLISVTNWKQYRTMIIALGTFVVLIGVYGILQEYAIVPIFDAMHLTDEIVVVRFFPGFAEERLSSTFAGAYDLAAFYLLALPILVALLVTASRSAKLVLAGILALSFFCFYLTYARTPLAALMVVLGVCLWLLGKVRAGIVLALLCVVPALLLGGFVERLAYAADDPFAYYAFGGRLQLGWADALAAAARSPLLGAGPASLHEGMGVDGLYFMLLGMWGLCGLVCFLVLIAAALRLQRECITSRNTMQRALAVGLFAGTFGLLVNGITLDSFFSSKIALSYWFLMGLLLAGRRLEAQNR